MSANMAYDLSRFARELAHRKREKKLAIRPHFELLAHDAWSAFLREFDAQLASHLHSGASHESAETEAAKQAGLEMLRQGFLTESPCSYRLLSPYKPLLSAQNNGYRCLDLLLGWKIPLTPKGEFIVVREAIVKAALPTGRVERRALRNVGIAVKPSGLKHVILIANNNDGLRRIFADSLWRKSGRDDVGRLVRGVGWSAALRTLPAVKAWPHQVSFQGKESRCSAIPLQFLTRRASRSGYDY